MNKLVPMEEAVARIPDGASIAIGGSALSRKPMALVRALARSRAQDLSLIVDVGGPEVDLLLGTGKVREVIYAFVGFEILGLAPHFRRARESGTVAFQEWTEYTVMAGLDAHIKRVPFLPTHSGLATDVLAVNAAFRRFRDPFHGEELVAIPALKPDFAFLHVNYADAAGNGVILGDSHVDVLCAKAAAHTFVSAERIIPSEELYRYGRDVQVLRIHTEAVIEAPWGAHPTGLAPVYRADLPALGDYLQAAAKPEAWPSYVERWINVSHQAYLEAVAAHGAFERLTVPDDHIVGGDHRA